MGSDGRGNLSSLLVNEHRLCTDMLIARQEKKR